MNTPATKPIHHFLKPDIEILWNTLEEYFQDLSRREIYSEADLLQWMKDRSELEAYLEEDFAWRYIHMTSETDNKEYALKFQFFAEEIEPKMAPWNDILNRKLMDSPFLSGFIHPPFEIFIRRIESQIKLYREENIPLLTELQVKQQEFGRISGAMSVTIQGQEYTMEQASTFLKDQDRNLRREAFEKIAERRMKDKNLLNELLLELVNLRQKVAKNAGFENFRDYSFEALGRFDYGPKETAQFQEAIKLEIVPIMQQLAEKRKKSMNLEVLKPWDMDVDISGKPPLKPFQNGKELIDKTIACFTQLDPFFGECIEKMKIQGLFDVESRKGKAPGGYNYPLAESGAPFIFMNSAGAFRDLTTMVHEGGHAVHTFLTRDLLLNDFKHLTSEIAELASMSMELLSMKYWDVFFPNSQDLIRAKEEQLVDVLKTFPWVAIVDSFQDQLYTQTVKPISFQDIWTPIYQEFGSGFCDWTGYEEYRDHLWQKQLHIFEVPFYYVEYAIAGLGAIAVWKNFTENPGKAIQDYRKALSMGYTQSIGEMYKTAGIRLDMSREYISELAQFIKGQIHRMEKVE
jgi:oligoendopeptidase F